MTRSPVGHHRGRGLLGLSDSQGSLCTLRAHSPPPCTGADTEAEGSVVSRLPARACVLPFTEEGRPRLRTPRALPAGSPGASCSGASEAGSGAPQPRTGLRNPCLLVSPRRGVWGGAVSIPEQQTPEQGPGTLKPHGQSGSWGQTAWVCVWVSSCARLVGLLPGELS